MELQKLSDLKGLIKDKPVKKLVLAAAQDAQSLGAVLNAGRDRIVEPVLIGDRDEIYQVAEVNNYELGSLNIIHEPDLEKSVDLAVQMVNRGEADVLMKGKVGTSIL